VEGPGAQRRGNVRGDEENTQGQPPTRPEWFHWSDRRIEG
jgi:hypothetical protein